MELTPEMNHYSVIVIAYRPVDEMLDPLGRRSNSQRADLDILATDNMPFELRPSSIPDPKIRLPQVPSTSIESSSCRHWNVAGNWKAGNAFRPQDADDLEQAERAPMLAMLRLAALSLVLIFVVCAFALS